MNRTNKLLLGVTVLILWSVGGAINNGVAVTASLNVPTPQDPKRVQDASNVIVEVLRNVSKQKAMTLNEVLAKRPSLRRTDAQIAIERLYMKGEIRRTGDGSSRQPFRYYDRNRSARPT